MSDNLICNVNGKKILWAGRFDFGFSLPLQSISWERQQPNSFILHLQYCSAENLCTLFLHRNARALSSLPLWRKWFESRGIAFGRSKWNQVVCDAKWSITTPFFIHCVRRIHGKTKNNAFKCRWFWCCYCCRFDMNIRQSHTHTPNLLIEGEANTIYSMYIVQHWLWFNCMGGTGKRARYYSHFYSRLFSTLVLHNSLSVAIFIITTPFIWLSWWIFIQIIKFTIIGAQRPSCRSWCWCWWLCRVFGWSGLDWMGFGWHTETEGIRNNCVCNGFFETSQSRLQIVFGFRGCTVPPLCYRSIGNSSWSVSSLFYMQVG